MLVLAGADAAAAEDVVEVVAVVMSIRVGLLELVNALVHEGRGVMLAVVPMQMQMLAIAVREAVAVAVAVVWM